MTVTAAPEPTGALAIQPGQTDWTPVQVAAFASIGLDKVPDPHRVAFLHLCQAKGLDPWQREIYLIGRNVKVKKQRKSDPDQWEVRYTPQTGIDGYLTLAEKTSRYEGRDEFEWCGEDGVWKDVWLSKEPPAAARAKVYRKGSPRPIVAVAHWAEYAPLSDEWVDTPNGRRPSGKQVLDSPMWRKMPAGQLAKCAFALALRAAFPRTFAGIYVDEEMHQADAQAREDQRRAEDEARRAGLAELRGDAAPPAPVVTRADLEAEFRGQAAVLGRTEEQLAARWAHRHGKALSEATDAELYDLVVGYREIVREAAKQTGGVVATAEETASERAAAEPEDQAPAPSARTREEMLEELAEQARILGKSPGQHVTRLLSRERCSLDDVSDTALAAFLAEQQPFVDEKVRADAATAPAKPAPEASPAGDRPGPHPFRYNDDGDNDACDEPGCGQAVDAAIHAPQPGPGQEPLL